VVGRDNRRGGGACGGGGGGVAVIFLPERFTQFANAWLLKSGSERTQIARIRKTNWFTNYRVAGNFSWEFNFGNFEFSAVRGKKTRIWISDFTYGNNFSRISC